MRVVLDTNIIVSALVAPRGSSAAVLLLALSNRFEMCISPPVLAEYDGVLQRPRFDRLDRRIVRDTLAKIREVARLVHPTRTLAISPDEADNRFYECAEAAHAEYLVTGNKRHFPRGQGSTAVVTPREFLELVTRLG